MPSGATVAHRRRLETTRYSVPDAPKSRSRTTHVGIPRLLFQLIADSSQSPPPGEEIIAGDQLYQRSIPTASFAIISSSMFIALAARYRQTEVGSALFNKIVWNTLPPGSLTSSAPPS